MRAEVAEPRTETELLVRAQRLAGRTVAEVASEHAVPVPETQKRAKGFVGTLVEHALGAKAGTDTGPDFSELGVELKTIPLGRDGSPRESTFVCTIPLSEIGDTDWGESRARKKLTRVLWIPIESERDVPLRSRRFGRPLLWSPTPEQDAVLAADWEELAGLIGRGDIEAVTGHLGQYLQVRPKAAHSGIRRRAPEADGAFLATVPRGFYLRAAFTRTLFESPSLG